MSFTEFCCRSGGSNLNAGTVDGSSTEPATASLVTYTGGDWNATTDVYTAPVGADMTEAQVGRFASLYHDGDTSPTNNQYMVARIIAVDSGARTITLSTTARMLFGTEVATGTGNRSMRIGGAWAGMSGSSGFPFSTVSTTITGSGAITNASGDTPRFNFKNDQIYIVTTPVFVSATGPYQIWGYSSSYGDFGRATIQAASGQVIQTTGTPVSVVLADLIVKHTGASGSGHPIYIQGPRNIVLRCVVSSSRQAGIWWQGADGRIIECELYNCNQGNNASQAGGITFTGASGLSIERCTIHDCAGGSNAHGIVIDGTGSCKVSDTIIDSNSGNGIHCNGATNTVSISNCDIYNNSGDGVRLTSSTASVFCAANSNFVKNGGYGINNTSNGPFCGLLANCGFGAGTQANTSGNTNNLRDIQEIGTVTYAADVTPWVDPVNGDFRITLAAAKNAGRGTFTQTASSYSGTVGYPDIGAAQSAATGGGSRMVNVRGGADQ